MINKNIRRIFLGGLILSAVSFTSCNKQDNDVFDKLPSEREKEQASKLQDILVSAPNGWKMIYFTDDTELGGYSFLMSFNKAGQVEMLGDFDEESFTHQISDYEIQLRGTTSLVFVTQNKIHKLSDPYNSPTTGNKGYKGDFQFRYYENDDNEITFRATKDIKQVVKLVKATKEDWDQFANRKTLIDNFNSYDVPVFRQIIVNDNGVESIYDGTYSGVTRFISSISDGTPFGLDKGVGIGFNAHGAVLSPAIDVKGEKFSNFEWNESEDAYVSTNSGNVQVRIKNVATPNEWSDSYKSVVFGSSINVRSFGDDAIMGAPSNSQAFLDLVMKEDGSAAIYKELRVTFNNGRMTVLYMMASGNYTYNARVVDSNGNGRLVMESGAWANSSRVPEFVKELHEAIFGSNIIFVKRQTYKVKYINEVISIYSGGNAIVFDGWVA